MSGTYTVTPKKTGYTFSPSSLTVSFNGTSVSRLSFSATAGSGGGAGGGVSISLTPATSTVVAGGTVQFTAAIGGSSNTAVTWAVTGGSISPAGLYTAPSTAGTYTVKASSVADSAKAASATVTVNSSSGFTGHNYSTNFSATENPISENGVWINGGIVGLDWTNVRTTTNFAFGTMSGTASGNAVYSDSTAVLSGSWGPNQTAQATVNASNPINGGSGMYEELELRLLTRIAAHSLTGYEINCSVDARNPYLQIVRWNGALGSFTQLNGAAKYCKTGDVLKATSTVSGSSVTLTAYLNGALIESATDSSGFTAGSPGMGFFLEGATGLNANYGFSAYSATDGIPSSSPGNGVSVSISPPATTVIAGATTQFTAAVTGGSNTAVAWSVTGGSISPSGLYTAPAAAGTYTVEVTSAADSTKSATATVTVTASPVVAVSISPSSATMKTGSTQQFAATVTGNSNTSVTWSASSGTISAAGVYTAPASAGSYTVKATSAADTTKSASANVTVTTAAPQIAVSPTAMNFSSITANTNSAQTLTLSNAGGSSLSVTNLTVTGSAFSVVGATLPITIGAGQSANVGVRFAPTTTGNFSGSISVSSNASNTAPMIPLSGSATAASTFLISASPTNLSFGSVVEGSSASKTVTLSNTGSGSVSITAANFTGSGFSLSGVTFPFTLAAGKTQNATISFAPETSGGASGTASFVSNATNSPATVGLSGSGTVPKQHSVDLGWNASTSSVVGYNVYRATISGGPYTRLTSSPQAGTTYVDSTVQSGLTYYYVVTAVSSSGTESSFSNQATAAVPTP